MHWLRLRAATLVGLEAVLIVSALALAAFFRFGEWTPDLLFSGNGVWRTLLVVVVTQGCLYYTDLYNLRLVTDRRELFIRLFQALAVASMILAGVYYWFPDASSDAACSCSLRCLLSWLSPAGGCAGSG